VTRRCLRELHELQDLLGAGRDLRHTVCQGFTVPAAAVPWDTALVDGLILLGCPFEDPIEQHLAQARGALLFPELPDLPYDPYRSALYRADELAAVDGAIWQHFSACGGAHPDILEALAQRLHDHAIDDGLTDLLEGHDRHLLVAVMGGHELRRDDERFAAVAHTTAALSAAGRTVLTGGGPGAMEAGNLGAYLAPHGGDAIGRSIETLAEAPHYTDDGYVEAARAVLAAFPDGAESVAVPTWFYGHEPTNLFAAWVAKYFSNSLREDRLLAEATGGILFAPGSAGTAQEVFQDAAPNHYGTFGPPSPMVFLDRGHWERTGLYAALLRQAEGKPYADLISLVDTPDEAVAALVR
jgi:predicted Rossmann-fold nucleotide-binding protein